MKRSSRELSHSVTASRRSFGRIAIASILIASAIGGGCVSEGPAPRPAPRAVVTQPTGLKVDRVVPAIDKLADDTDRNGYYDTLRLAVFLFSNDYTQSIQCPGSMTCTLSDPQTNKVIAKWEFSAERVQKAWGMSGVMPGYNFLLNINEVGTDKIEAPEALFDCVFTPTGGKPVVSLSRLVVLVGPRR